MSRFNPYVSLQPICIDYDASINANPAQPEQSTLAWPLDALDERGTYTAKDVLQLLSKMHVGAREQALQEEERMGGGCALDQEALMAEVEIRSGKVVVTCSCSGRLYTFTRHS